MRRVGSIVTLACAFLIWSTSQLYAQGPTEISFEEEVLPIFQNNCAFSGCHKEPGAPFRLDLSSLEGVMRGSERRRVVIPGDSENSPLVKAVEGRDELVPRMPFLRPPLDPELIDIIRTWIDQLEEEEIEEVSSSFAVTNSVVKRARRPGQDSFQISGVYHDGGAGLGLPDAPVTLALGTAFSETIPAGSFVVRGTKFVFQDRARGLNISFDTRKKSFTVNATKQNLSGLADPAEFSIEVGALADSELIPTSGRFVGGKNRPLSAVFYVTKGTTRRGRTAGTDQFTLEGVLFGQSGLPAVSAVKVQVEFGPFAETIPAGSFRLRRGSQSQHEFVAPRGKTGLTRVTINTDTGKFTVSAVRVDLSELTSPAALRLQMGNVAGRATLALSASAAGGFRYP